MWLKGPLYVPRHTILPPTSDNSVDFLSITRPVSLADVDSNADGRTGIVTKSAPVVCQTCDGIFHARCLLSWFEQTPQRSNCPNCRSSASKGFILKTILVRTAELQEMETMLATKQDEAMAAGEYM